jgi:hypothetical protein
MKTKINTKIKVNAVNEVEFEKTDSGEYKYRFPAKLSIKMENLVMSIVLKEADDWDKEHYPERLIGDDILVAGDSSYMETIKGLNLSPDWSEVIKAYKAGLSAAKFADKAARIIRHRKEYDASWIHSFINMYNNSDINKEEFIVRPNRTEEEYIKDCMSPNTGAVYLDVKIEHRGKEFMVEKSRGKFILSSFYDVQRSRRYSIPLRVFKTIKELVEEKLLAAKAQAKAEKKKAESLSTDLGLLKRAFGNVIHRSEYRSAGHGRRKGYSWQEDTFYVVIDQSKVEDYCTSGLVKVNYYEGAGKVTYTVKGISGLNLTQAKTIIKIIKEVEGVKNENKN